MFYFLDYFQFPKLFAVILSVALTVAYFVMLSDRLNLKLITFFVVSMIFTLIFVLVSLVLFPSLYFVLGLPQCILYDVGSLMHLISGKTTVKQVTALR